MDAYRNPYWPTRDGVVPFRVFYQMLAMMRHVLAAEQLESSHATAHGAALAMNGKDSKVQSTSRALARVAYPTVNDAV